MEIPPLRAAEYLRMSTEHQQYSIENQSAAIQDYANAHSIEIVRTYVDPGKSGLRIKGRRGLKDLFQTVESRAADFNVVLVYDVSRWGRFQDVDESAYYEYSLRRAGISVVYCAEPFSANGGPADALLKALKRAMAAEYSRELSVKVSEGQRRIAALGYRLGGLAGFGFRRVAVDPTGLRRMVLEDGERKSVKTDRITLIHGPEEEVRAVRKVFDLFVSEGLSEATIATYLNERGIMTKAGNRWQQKTINDMLANPKYAGDLVLNRTITKLGSVPVKSTRDQWIYVPERFPPIISREIWNGAQDIFRRRAEQAQEEEMLARLRALLSKHGRLSYDLIDAEPGMRSAQTYHRKFGSMIEVYSRVGWRADRRYKQIASRAEVRARCIAFEDAITSKVAVVADHFSKDAKVPLWTVNEDTSIYVAIVAPRKFQSHRLVWNFYGMRKTRADFLVIARLDLKSSGILDYYVFPGCYTTPIRIFEQNPWSVDIHRFEDLSFLDIVCQRSKLSDPEN